ncbi:MULTISPECIES: flagellar motor switch protein FliM [Burkholderiaceae]|jgi:flagellar motor switch protein FliM|uniref:Flagellar motor switch protein FliM n=1 Tax=Caballeronia sordidicola TaxID=196367 RepID=A0A242M864_CABSO|nr:MULTISPECIES: flagellar motor switch protein FliM [Burkholderiaceae]MDP9155236.1 flagellar motor switch protein FliM [Pseudomonadota bacterium]AME23331.1 flagellar motor switch protein FliM [Burkholderia sp. PAMC 26561]AMM15239.1 flagellar motor switch protein FliM [Burkholderia sp. PAMC 28687]OTP67458.1 Flagellar motor switch protein FliM [Caballeronia sordidicola]OTP78945.1 Flagellar motor switch protein FliM [Caballeronia sordidicola]
MGHEEFMSQEEVDALLKGVTGEVDAVADETRYQGVRPYNLATQERIVRGRMPGLEIINDRFARLLRVGIFNFMRRSAEISVGPVKVQKYSEFTRNLPIPTNLNLVHVKPLRGTSLFVFDPNLVFFVVDNLFGGDGRFHTRVEGREFTQTEHRIISKLLNLVFEQYAASWKSVRSLNFEFVRSEMHTQFANVATPNEIVIVTQFSIEFGSTGGTLHICMPYSMIEPIRDVLSSPIQGEALEVDRRWIRVLSQQVQSAEVELTVDLAQIGTTFEQILNMRAGDVLPINVPEEVTAKVDGVPVMECGYGVFNGQYALRVQKMISATDTMKEGGYE